MRPLLLLLAAAAAAAPALAQGGPPEIQRIEVDTRASACTYTLSGSADGETFEIAPGGRVLFRRVGPALVSVTVKDASGVPGTQNGNSLVFKPAETERGLTARAARGASSTHRVEIRCCTERSGPACAAWSDPAEPPADLGARPAPPPGAPTSGPAAAPPTDRPAADGPRMVVKE